MALIRWEPAREAHSLQQEFNRLFGTFFDSQTGERRPVARRWVPAVDLVEEGEHYVLRADLPGLGEDDVKVELDGRILTVSGERSSEREDRGEGYYRIERASGSFSRSLRLPEGVDADAIEASFENGVLEVKIPKPEAHKPRRVEVKAAAAKPAVSGGEAVEPSEPAEQSEAVEPSEPTAA
jgi:HSP20 family protein